jgi:penicillin V acylase-like amidase (Ntn superfamily)
MTIAIGGMAMSSMAFFPWHQAQACSRVLYETGNRAYITGRTMDWADASAKTALWVFPRGMKLNGGVGRNPIKWTS